MSTKLTFTNAMKELEELNAWFQRDDIDLEEGLHKLKRGKELVAFCQARLKELENEFQLIQDSEA